MVLVSHSLSRMGFIPFTSRLCTHPDCLWLFLCCFLAFSAVTGNSGDRISFVEPTKNITSNAGSNIEFFCSVQNLGHTRIMWVKKEEEREVLLGINTLKVTKNPRISFSMVPNSDDVSQSILYINNIELDDSGVYHCIVDTTPNKVQVGTLVVKEHHHPPPSQFYEPTTTETPTTSTATTTTTTTKTPALERNESETESESEQDNSGVICINVKKMWTETRQVAQYLFSIFKIIF